MAPAKSKKKSIQISHLLCWDRSLSPEGCREHYSERVKPPTDLFGPWSSTRGRSKSRSVSESTSKKKKKTARQSAKRESSSTSRSPQHKRKCSVGSSSRSRSESLQRPGKKDEMNKSWKDSGFIKVDLKNEKHARSASRSSSRRRGRSSVSRSLPRKRGRTRSRSNSRLRKVYIGRVRKFTKGYGFAECRDFGSDVFIHRSNITNTESSLRAGDECEFEVETLPDGRYNGLKIRVLGGSGEYKARYHSASPQRGRRRRRDYSRSYSRDHDRGRGGDRREKRSHSARCAKAADVTKNCNGVVERWNHGKPFGFVQSPQFHTAIFCHQSEIVEPRGTTKLNPGDEIIMDVETLKDGRFNCKNVYLSSMLDA